jgi:hypothetical protein
MLMRGKVPLINRLHAYGFGTRYFMFARLRSATHLFLKLESGEALKLA